MAEPFIGQVRIFGFNYAPSGWAFCSNGTLPIEQHSALYSLLGTQFGGDGRNSFGLPDMRGRVPVHIGTATYHYGSGTQAQTIRQGEKGGTETKTLTLEDMEPHTHPFRVLNGTATSREPADLGPAEPSAQPIYGPADNLVAMDSEAVGPACAGLPMNNVQRSLPLNFCIALEGLYPTRGDN